MPNKIKYLVAVNFTYPVLPLSLFLFPRMTYIEQSKGLNLPCLIRSWSWSAPSYVLFSRGKCCSLGQNVIFTTVLGNIPLGRLANVGGGGNCWVLECEFWKHGRTKTYGTTYCELYHFRNAAGETRAGLRAIWPVQLLSTPHFAEAHFCWIMKVLVTQSIFEFKKTQCFSSHHTTPSLNILPLWCMNQDSDLYFFKTQRLSDFLCLKLWRGSRWIPGPLPI